ncbi:hypothetical protein Fot_07431 [Forsythia ovata]|uniref:Protein PLASTID MOVEMENT IMPAIRED 1-RELATED 1-like n=1 Tax=Forsythia ovata TaxID=205694 RepID=A0ABD1WVS9_9LAMI
MFSKTGSSRKKIGENSGDGMFLKDLGTINKGLYMDKTWPRAAIPTISSRSKAVEKSHLPESKKAVEKSHLPESKTKPKDANNTKNSLDKNKKSIWSWKGIKALTHIRNRRFNCCFSLQVHSIEGLPATFNDISLVVYWKRREGELMTVPVRVHQGVAKFEEQLLTHKCSVYGSRSGPYHSAKYEAKHFLVYVLVYDAPELDLGKHRVDLTRLLPLTLEELEEEKNLGKWTTSFRLSGKARGATMNVSFGYVVIGDDTSVDRQMSLIQSLRQDCASTTELGELDHKNELNIPHVGSVPARSSTSNLPAEDIKELHEVMPISRSKLSDSVKILYQKLDEENSCDYKLEVDSFSEPASSLKPNTRASDAGKESSETEWETTEGSVVEKAIEDSEKENVQSDVGALNFAQGSDGGSLENASAIKVPLDRGIPLLPSVEEIGCRRDDPSISDHNSEQSEVCTKESLIEGLETALTSSDLVNEGFDTQEDESDVLHQEKSFEIKSNYRDVPLSLETAQGSDGEGLENASTIKVPLDRDVPLLPSVEEIGCRRDEPSISDYNSKQSEVCTRESLIGLETALTSSSDFVNEGFDSQEDESDVLHQEKSFEIQSNYRDHRKGKSLSLDDVNESVASEFLERLEIEHSPFGLSSESEPESPRERLLRQFEKDALSGGSSLFNFDMDNNSSEFVNDFQSDSVWEPIYEDFHNSSMFQDYEEMTKIETDAVRTKTRASVLEGLETEVLMREWGLNGDAFQHSPPSSSGGFGSPIDVPPEDPQQLPPLAEGLGSFIQTKNGGFLRSMNPVLFKNAKNGGSLVMQVSSPVVVPAEMGSGIIDILQGLASVGIEKLSMQANKLMPLEDITGKTMQQIAWEASSSLDESERQGLLQHESEHAQNISLEEMRVEAKSFGSRLNKFNSGSLGSDSEYVSLEDLAPFAMDKIEALSIEGLRIQSGMSDEDASSNISPQSIGGFSALKGKTVDVGGSVGLDGTGGLQLLDIKDNGEDIDGLMGLSLTLDEWMRLDSGEIDDEDLISERTSKILAAHHATSLDSFHGRSRGEKRRGKGRKCGLLGNNFTVALMVQLRDPLRNYESVGTPMLSLIQVERVFVPPKPKIYSTVSQARSYDKEEEESKTAKSENIIEESKEDKIHEEVPVPQYKITEVHVAGLKIETGKKKLWGSSNQEKSGSRWLLANGMGKKKHPLMKSKAIANSSAPASSPAATTVQPGDTLWSISSRVHGTGAKWKELAALNPHIRNPNVIFPNEKIRLC